MIQDCPTAATPRLALLALVSILVAAYAPTLVQQATQFTAETGKSFRLSRTAKVPLSTGYSTTLQENSRWELVGTIPHGNVH